MTKNVTLYRPVGAEELVLVIDSGMKSFSAETLLAAYILSSVEFSTRSRDC